MKQIVCVLMSMSLFGSDFILDERTQTVAQNPDALIWQDDEQVSQLKMSYKSALSYCKSLGLIGKTDWRMPTRNELYRIVDLKRTPTILPIFTHTASECYWSDIKDFSDRIGYIDFSTGESSSETGLDHSCYVRCVRKTK